MTFRIKGRGITAVLSLLALCVPSALAQATFGVGASTPPAADIGAAELTGAVVLTIQSGTSVASSFRIVYSSPITNNAASEILMLGTGNLVGVAANPTIDRANNAIVVDVPAGGVAGNRISIQGVRVSLQGMISSQVTASITSSSASGNAIAVGQDVATVIGAILAPLTVDLCCDQPLAWVNGRVTNPGTTVLVKEGYASAFGDNVGIYGQNVASQIRVNPFPSIPPGVKLTFSASAGSTETTAKITTLSGNAETVPREDGSTSVVYVFSGVQGSQETIESFRITISAEVSENATTGTVTFQATLLPVGVTQPNATYPSNDIPRYSERTLPNDYDLVTGSTDLLIPFRAQSEGTYSGIALTNPQNFRVKAVLTASDASGNLISGAGITNPTTVILPARGQIGKVASEVFGAGFNATAAGSIRVTGKTSILPGFYLIGDSNGPRLDGATADMPTVLGWVLPAVFHQGPSPATVIEAYNPGTSVADVTFRLFSSEGEQKLSPAIVHIPPNGFLASDVTGIFPGLNITSFEGGYIKAISNALVVSRVTFGNALDNNVLGSQSGIQRPTMTIAHYATGGGFSTELDILNNDPATVAQITLTALDNNGTALAIAGNPKHVTIEPGHQLIENMRELYPALSGTLNTGYIRMEVASSSSGPFSTTPIVLGFIRFSAADGTASAALPLFLPPYGDFVYSHVAQNLGYYTGIALLNTNSAAATAKLEVYDKNGLLVGSYTTILQPGQKVAKLVYEMIPASLGQIGGYVKIHSSLPINSFALFGTNDLRSLSAIPPQPISQ